MFFGCKDDLMAHFCTPLGRALDPQPPALPGYLCRASPSVMYSRPNNSSDHLLYFTNEETKTQRENMTCLRSHSEYLWGSDSNSGTKGKGDLGVVLGWRFNWPVRLCAPWRERGPQEGRRTTHPSWALLLPPTLHFTAKARPEDLRPH